MFVWLRAPIRASAPIHLAVMGTIGYVAFLVDAAIVRVWPLDRDGHPALVDYLSMWAAGRLALAGHAAAAYDWTVHKAAEIAAVGYDFDGYFSWFYPPTFFFAVAPFAVLPFVPALLAWITAGIALFLAAVRLLLPRRETMIFAAAAPVVLLNAMAGQNGCLSAAIFAAGLALLERRPILSGALLACLTFKPQFGLLIPIALAAGGYWRVFGAAAGATLALAAASLAVFGADAWVGFAGSIAVANRTILVEAGIGADKLQSLFGLLRAFGEDTATAWTGQMILAVPVAGFVAWLWRSPASFDIKAAALIAGAALVTPYVLIYDLVILVVPVAFLARSGLTRGETIATAAAAVMMFSRLITGAPVGLAASLIVFGMVVGRALRTGAAVGLPHKRAA